jgi:hypothetical protein
MILIEMKNGALLNLAHVIELKADFTGETKDGLKGYGIHASTVDGKTRKVWSELDTEVAAEGMLRNLKRCIREAHTEGYAIISSKSYRD